MKDQLLSSFFINIFGIAPYRRDTELDFTPLSFQIRQVDGPDWPAQPPPTPFKSSEVSWNPSIFYSLHGVQSVPVSNSPLPLQHKTSIVLFSFASFSILYSPQSTYSSFTTYFIHYYLTTAVLIVSAPALYTRQFADWHCIIK